MVHSPFKMKSKQKHIILEDIGDWNPLEILGTAGKYYIDLAKSDNPRQQFRKDLKDAGVDDILQGVSAVPFIGLPFGLASIGLNLAAGNTRKALIQVVATAGAAVGAKAVGAGFSQAAANPRVVEAAARLLNSVAQRMGGLPSIGPSIATGAQRLGKKLAEAMSDLAESAAENEIADAVEDSKAVATALNKLSKSKVAKKISGKDTAANRKDSSLTNELYSNTEDSLREVRTVKISKSSIRKLVKESIKKSGISLNRKVITEAAAVNNQGELVLGQEDVEQLAAGKAVVIPAERSGKRDERIALQLMGGKATLAGILKLVERSGEQLGATLFDASAVTASNDLGASKTQPKSGLFGLSRGDIKYVSKGGEAMVEIPASLNKKDGGSRNREATKGMAMKRKVEPIIFKVTFESVGGLEGPNPFEES